MNDSIALFDRKAVRRQRGRAAENISAHDFLYKDVAGRLADRLQDIKRQFETVLDIGGGHGAVELAHAPETYITGDLSETLLKASDRSRVLVMDEEFLPFSENSLDLVISCLALHWANDLPGALVQICRALKPDGLFLAAVLGGDTLIELRHVFLEAEAETTGGTSPRTSPVVEIADTGTLLQRAGFALPVVDTDILTVTYSDVFALMRDLRGMGATNALAARNRYFLRRDTLFAAAKRYEELYTDADGRISATFQIIWLIGWAPSGSQQQPLRPGSANIRLADALEANEKIVEKRAGPGKKA